MGSQGRHRFGPRAANDEGRRGERGRAPPPQWLGAATDLGSRRGRFVPAIAALDEPPPRQWLGTVANESDGQCPIRLGGMWPPEVGAAATAPID